MSKTLGLIGLRVGKTFAKLVLILYKLASLGIMGILCVLCYNKICLQLREFFTFRVETVNVTVQEGELKGRKVVSVLGKTYYRFQGIPYAKPPVGPLRFKDPEPPEPWKGVRSALKEGDICIQADVITGFTRGSENCLFLNVFTPELPKDDVEIKKKAVMVWIHGGGFHLGSGNAEIYGPDFFMNDDVVLVTLNYRLGVIGFLSTGTDDAPGNAGLKDIVMALKWVQQNIAAFGGDPDNVTIFGESAGGACVHYLLLSPLGKGLFKQAISQSGSALCPWAINEDPLDTAFRLGRAFGLETNDPKALVDYLRKISPKVLAKKQNVAISEDHKRSCIPFAFVPCVEPETNSNPLITKHPLKLLENGSIPCDVPYITGINEMEGMILLKLILDNMPPAKELDKDFERLVPKFLNLPYGSEESKEVAEKIREFYFDNRPLNKKTYKEYVDLRTDAFFFIDANRTTRLHTKFTKSPVYNYEFKFDGDFGLFKKILNIKNIPGPAHADELGYLFHVPILGPNIDSRTKEMKLSKKMVRLWTNFAKYGNPTPEGEDTVLGNLVWEPYSNSDQNYLIIGDDFRMDRNMNDKRLKFWQSINEKLGQERRSCWV